MSNIPVGYKQTEVGVIPEDWDCLDAGTAIRFFGGKGFSSRAETKDGIRWLKIANVGIEKVKWEFTTYLPEKFLDEFNEYVLKPNDVVMALTRPVLGDKLKVARLSISDAPALLNQRVAKLIPKGDNKVEYLFYVVQQLKFITEMNNAMAGTDPPNIGNAALEKIAIAVPRSPAEQTAIAAALSDADSLITSLEELIAKKRNIKQGAMQELLKPKKGWVVKRLGEIFTFSGGYSASREQLSADGFCYLHYGDIHGAKKTFINVKNEYTEIPKLKVPLKKVSPKSMLNDGDIVFVDASEDDEGTSRHIVVKNPDGVPYISGLHTIVAKSLDDYVNNDYKRYCFQSAYMKGQFKFYAVGTKVSGISKTNIAKIEIALPSSEEQTRIAAILSDMDAEIEALEKKLEKYRRIKQGMMQELLTGRTRLIESTPPSP